MAGAGYKLFTTGSVLTAAEVNTYLQEQTVMVFADATARTTALSGVVAEGMLSYLKDTDVIQYYNGSSWTTVNTDQTPLTTKGDLFTYSTADARLAVGNNGESLVADSSATTGLRWQGSTAAGRNFVINGGFDIWQRGTSSSTQSAYTTADRWWMNASASTTFSQETSVIPTNARYALKAVTGATANVQFRQVVETNNAVLLAGKTVTLSGLFQASSTTTIQIKLFSSTSVDNSVSGSWSEITPSSGGSVSAVNGSFTRGTGIFAVPSTAKSLMILFDTSSTPSGVSLYYAQIQLELGSVPTEFSRAGATIAGELGLCQRYYYRTPTGGQLYSLFSQWGTATSSTLLYSSVVTPVTMRITPTSIDFASLRVFGQSTGVYNSISAVALDGAACSLNLMLVQLTSTGLTTNAVYGFGGNNSATAHISFNAEL